VENDKNALNILKILKKEYSEVGIALVFNTPFELLVATILSAQCTDDRVNKITLNLFKKYHIPEDYLKVSDEELEKDIFSAGFYKQKAKSIKQASNYILINFNGEIPNDFDKLTEIPGVGRKTASVVAGNAFGIPSIAVDTHVIRISNLLHFVNTKDPVKIEAALKLIFPENQWVMLSHYIATHGRRVCIARKPKCSICQISEYCPSKGI